MNTVSAAFLAQLRAATGDFCTVVELYESDTVPTSGGFDPSSGGSQGGFAQIGGVQFRGVDYLRQVKSIGGLKRSTGKDFNSCSVTFTNLDQVMATFHLANDIEGMLLVVRLLSRSASMPRSRQDIVWGAIVFAQVGIGNRLTAFTGDDNWNSGASSTKQLEAGVTGYVELTVGPADPERMFGLGDTGTGGNFARIDHAMYLTAGVIIPFESGSNMGPQGTYEPADVLRVERIGTTVRYKKNGTTFYTSGVAAGGALYANATVKLNGTSLEPLTLSGFGAQSTLADSMVLFVGRCEKAVEVSKTDFRVTAKHVIGSIAVELPRRKYSYDDTEGRSPTSALFEGFRYIPQTGTIQFAAREKRGGLGALLGMSKPVTRSLQFSSHSALDAEKPVPMVLGRVQMLGTHIAYADVGNSLAMLTAWCDGGDYGIYGFVNIRNVSPQFTELKPFLVSGPEPAGIARYRLGLTGTYNYPAPAGFQAPIPGTVLQSAAASPHSRSANTYTYVNGSAIEADDPAPDIACVIFGMRIDKPDGSGDFVLQGYSDNPIYQARFILHSPTHMNLDDGWFDDAALLDEAAYCDEILVDNASSDAAFLPDTETGFAGTDYKLFQSSGVITPDWFQFLEDETGSPYEVEADYQYYDPGDPGQVPIEPIDPPDPTDPGPGQIAANGFRRRYTSNVLLTETMPAVDFLYDVLFAGSRLFLTQAATGQLRIKVKRPADNTLLRQAAVPTDTVLEVYNVNPWRLTQRGRLLIGAHRATSEVREVTGGKYSIDGNSITLVATGGVTASGSTLTGGDGLDAAASGTVTVTTASGTKRIEIDGYVLEYTGQATDTLATVAGMISAQINSHPTLQKYITTLWTPGDAVVYIYALLGRIELADPIANSHDGPLASPTVAPVGTPAAGGSLVAGDYQLTYSYVDAYGGETLRSPIDTETVTTDQKINVSAITPLPAGVVSARWYVSLAPGSNRRRLVNDNNGSAFSILSVPATTAGMEPQFNNASEELIRVEMAFSDRALAASDHTAADIIRGSLKWPLGGNQSTVNQVEVSYRDAIQDWRLTQLTIRDDNHQAKVKKKLPFKLNGQAIDNYHQAARIANGMLAELRDADFFHAWAADREAILLEEGDVVCVTDSSGGFINSPCRIESLDVSLDKGFPKVTFTARKYSSTLYDDRVTEKNIPLPTTLGGLVRRGSLDLDVTDITIVAGEYTLSRQEATTARQIIFTGLLTEDLVFILPDAPRDYIVSNQTTGLFTVHVATLTAAQVLISRGPMYHLFYDGTVIRPVSGYLGNPVVYIQSDYSTTLDDRGKLLVHMDTDDTTRLLTLHDSATYEDGDVLHFLNLTPTPWTIGIDNPISLEILTQIETGDVGPFDLAQYGRARAEKVGSQWWIDGNSSLTVYVPPDPSTITGLTVWLKADILSLSDGDPVASWTDSSGNANHATQGTSGNRPTFQTNEINGLPIIRFDGTDDYLTLPDMSALTTGEVYILLKNTNLSAAGGLWQFGTSGNASHVPFSDNNIYDDFGTTVRKSAGDPTPSMGSFALYHILTKSGEWTARVNNASFYTTATNTVGFNTAPTIGMSAAGQMYPGDIAEFILYDAELSSPERAVILTYLNLKYTLGF